MAMRVAFGSMRLTKDIDFDRTADMSTSAVKGLLKRGMQVVLLRSRGFEALRST